MKLDEGTLRTVELTANADRFPLAAGPLALWLDTKVAVRGEAKGETLRIKTRIPGGTVHLPRLTESRSVQAIGPLDDVVFVDAAAVRAAQAKARAEEKKEQEAREGRGGPPILLPTRTLLAVDVDNFYVTGPEVKTGVVGHIDLELGEKSKLPVVTGEVHTIGGTVTGTNLAGLVLQNNVGDNLAVNSAGAFTFASSLAAGAAECGGRARGLRPRRADAARLPRATLRHPQQAPLQARRQVAERRQQRVEPSRTDR